MIKLVPDWAYWIVIAVLAVGIGVQQVRVAHGQTELAQEQKAHSDETAIRMKLALDHTAEIGRLTAQHAADQQHSEERYAEINKALADERRADAVTTNRLRDKLAAYTSGDRRPGETDTVASERSADRLQALGRMVREGVELLTEARSIIGRRDGEVARLLDQIKIDRTACSPS